MERKQRTSQDELDGGLRTNGENARKGTENQGLRRWGNGERDDIEEGKVERPCNAGRSGYVLDGKTKQKVAGDKKGVRGGKTKTGSPSCETGKGNLGKRVTKKGTAI